ncbi:MAG: ABC transporter permease [Phycisphaerales bacterium]
MIRRFLRSRGVRKFRRNRLALFASGIILVYFLIFLGIVGTEILDATGATDAQLRYGTRIRVLPRLHPGFLEKPTIDQRYLEVAWHHDRLKRVFDRDLTSVESPREALGELDLAERKVIDSPLPEVIERFRAFSEKFAVLNALYYKRDALRDTMLGHELSLKRAVDSGDTAGAESIRAKMAESEPEAERVFADFDEALTEAEASLRELMPMPTGWDGVVYAFRTFLGSDVSGRSIACKGFYSIKTAFQIGFVVATVAVIIGTALGAAAAFYGRWVDNGVMWLVSTLSSVPYLVLLAVLAYMFTGSHYFDNPTQYPELQLVKLYTAMGLAFWISTCRVIRGEVMKIKELEYVQAATAIGFGRPYILVKHVIPNTAHIMFINFSLLFIGAIKSEVILSFLGLGVSGQPSWGTMISSGKDDLSNFFFWEVGSASVLLFILVLAFNIVSDALQDAFDPKHV